MHSALFFCFVFIGVVVQFGVRLEVFVIVFGHMTIFFLTHSCVILVHNTNI